LIEEILIYEDVSGHAEFIDTEIEPIEIYICANDGEYHTFISDFKHAHGAVPFHIMQHGRGGRFEKFGAPRIQRLVIAHPDPQIHNKHISEQFKRRAKKHSKGHIKLLERHYFNLSGENKKVIE